MTRFKGDPVPVTRQYLLNRYGDPLDGLIAMSLPDDPVEATKKVDGVAKALGCKPSEARRLMEKASKEVRKYRR